MKITLINPLQSTSYPQPPVGLALIAAVLEKQGHRVTLLDANALGLRPEAAAARVGDADIAGLTAMTPTISAAISLASHLKQVRPRLTVILGGAHATLLPEETLTSAPEIDIIVRGEGEETVVELLQAIEARQPLESIAGISYRTDGKISGTPDRPPSVNLDTLPYPAYHLLSWKRYKPHPPHGLAMPFAAVVTSRGCPYRCAYCSKPVFGAKFRAQSPGRVIDEIAYLHDRFGVKEIAFYDDSFTLDKERVQKIAEKIIGSGMKMAWTCETRVNLVDRQLLLNMKRAGCYAVAYGIESGSAEVLKTLRKDITLEQVEEAVRHTREVGLQVIGYFMVGSPGETPETIRQTIDYAKKLKVDYAQFSVTTPFPGTELYDVYMRGRSEPIPWDSFVYAGTDNPVAPVFESESLSRDDLKYWVKQAYREFYLRPEYIKQRLGGLTSPGALRLNLKGLLMLLRSISAK
ncbi:MAG: radical SAM protein [Chloroflexota bacterium]